MKAAKPSQTLQTPQLAKQAAELASYLQTLTIKQLTDSMKISPALATKTQQTIQAWTTEPNKQSVALDTFKGDIYSGLQAPDFSPTERDFANQHLVILSGLYGLIRPIDGICPYRLELMYRLPDEPYKNLYKFWGSAVADQLPPDELIANLSSVEYSKLVTPFVDPDRVISPQFFTNDPKTGEPKFVTVHSKIARGAFARWLIQTKTDTAEGLNNFNLLGYKYNAKLSQPGQPAFVTKEFGGIGLSIRLDKPKS